MLCSKSRRTKRIFLDNFVTVSAPRAFPRPRPLDAWTLLWSLEKMMQDVPGATSLLEKAVEADPTCVVSPVLWMHAPIYLRLEDR